MRHRLSSAAWLWLLLPLPAMATPCTSSSPTTAEIISQGLGAPSVPIERRRELTDKLLCSALAGNVESQEVAGLLYYAGPARHGNVLPRDLSRARRLLTAAANRGRRHAMHVLAELELLDGHAYEAALWTRVEHELHGSGHSPTNTLQRRIEAGVSPDQRLDRDVALKVQTIREAMLTDITPSS
ncbi:hypothetical protein [Luteibacter sp. UNCMF366Tsu5.1]|uniref:hypothetical protein n=1 Tax=Luteibacter sp. UNCMF366Tsu5.1 TaxID=1502758 RepID=UPI0009090902|nr:hypothetical protein [Luteibacter sp. UNCMF366Tsu5.1]SFW41235.1 hypothetical protein SAMN02800691_1646 [Luteibacter sp. UNCMF366Tsu5.1]